MQHRIDEMANLGTFNSIESIRIPSQENFDQDTIPHIYLDNANEVYKWYIPDSMPSSPEQCKDYFDDLVKAKVSDNLLQDLFTYLHSEHTCCPVGPMYDAIVAYWCIDFPQYEDFKI